MALLSINGVGALTVRALLFSINAWAHSPRAANHPKIVTIRALYRDPMPLMMVAKISTYRNRCNSRRVVTGVISKTVLLVR